MAPVITECIEQTSGVISLEWNLQNASGGEEYVLERALSSDFSDAITVYSGENTTATDTVLDSDTYRYRVGVLEGGQVSEWSTTESILIYLQVAYTPWSEVEHVDITLLFPPELQISYDFAVPDISSITWTESENAEIYILERSMSKYFDTPETVILYSGPDKSFQDFYEDSGKYYFRVRAVNNTLDLISRWSEKQDITVSLSINAAFRADRTSGVRNLEVQFSDYTEGVIERWLWDFGDGTTSEEQNPLHFFNRPGRYTVSLTVWSFNDEDTCTKRNYITVTSDCVLDKAPDPGIFAYLYGKGFALEKSTGVRVAASENIDGDLGFSRKSGPTLIFD